MHKPNNLLEADVRDQFDWDPQLDAARINVSADHGRVALTGSVPTYFDSMRAFDDTTVVGGVTEVDNELLVGPIGEALTDADVALACKKALDADRFVPKGAVTADVIDGLVTLHGEVRRHFQRQAAEHAVGKVDGVLGVYDNITLTNAPIPSDVAARINKAFQRNAIIDDSLIKVSNDGGTIYLDGEVSSWNARNEAEDTAWSAPGVTDVVDRTLVIA